TRDRLKQSPSSTGKPRYATRNSPTFLNRLHPPLRMITCAGHRRRAKWISPVKLRWSPAAATETAARPAWHFRAGGAEGWGGTGRKGGGGGPRGRGGSGDRRHHSPERRRCAGGDGRRDEVRGREGLRQGGDRDLWADRLLLQQRRHRGQARTDRGIRRGHVR